MRPVLYSEIAKERCNALALGAYNAALSSGKVNILIDKEFEQYRDEINIAVKELGLQGEISIVKSIKATGVEQGYVATNIKNFDNGGNPFLNEIRLNPNAKDIKTTIRHELRHVYQGQKGIYYQKKEDGIRYHYWKGEKYISSDDFRKINKIYEKNNF